MKTEARKPLLLIVDDDRNLLSSIALILERYDYSFITCGNGTEALSIIAEKDIDVVISDLRMPGMTGLELIDRIKKTNAKIPIMLMTAYAELDIAVEAIRKGAYNFIIKPINPELFLNLINQAIEHANYIQIEKNYKEHLEKEVAQKTSELYESLILLNDLSNEIVKRLTMAAEFRDTDTGEHIKRIGLYVSEISGELKMPSKFIEAITFASQLHDVGKIGIADGVLLKPGKLSPDEWKLIKSHPLIGAKILSNSSYPKIKASEIIALYHHERWDGGGYPYGLKGDEIPLEARITIICDQYDALKMRRPYKPPLSHQEVIEIITKGDGRTQPDHFDPEILNVFRKISSRFEEIFNSYMV